MKDKNGSNITIDRLINRRKNAWNIEHSLEIDRELTEHNINLVLSDRDLMSEIIDKPYKLIELAMLIVDKRAETVPFFLNDVQKDFVDKFENRDGRPIFVLKGRQQGFTSLITAIQLAYTITTYNFSGFTVADCNDNVSTIFNDKARVVYDRLPSILHPSEKYNNRREFFFDKLNSSWRVSMASEEMGRSKTINFCHFSEVAFYECELSSLQKSIGEAFTPDAIVIYESTANGYNQAKDLWDSGSCMNLFYEWWRTSEYTSTHTELLLEPRDKWIADRIKWLEERHISAQSIAWYVQKYNSYLDKDSIKQEYPCYPEEAFISSSGSEFGTESIIEQIGRVKNNAPCRIGYFDYIKRRAEDSIEELIIDNIEWVEDKRGYITIHEEPNERRPYAIGGDTSGEGSDYFAAKVIDNISGKTVATLHKQHIDDDLYAEQVYCLGRMYNDAIIGIEINFSRESMKHLNNCRYENLYVTEKIDSITDRPTEDLGFRTTSISRPVIIAEYKRKWRDSNGTIEVDLDTLNEMLTFVRNEKGKPEAMIGKHDDLVMALCIAHFVGNQGEHSEQVPKREILAIERMFPDAFRETSQKSVANEYMEW